MLDALLEAFSGPGAAFMYAITAILALGLAVVLERGFLFWIKWRLNSGALLDKIRQGSLDEAVSAAGNHPVKAIVQAGKDAPADITWDAMSAQAALVENDVRSRVDYLATIGNISTMLGLLGTVYGLILAFSGLGDASAAERTARLSEGIATAMATTAWGLLVGIPALGAHAVVSGKAAQILSTVEAVASELAAARRR